MNDSGSQDAAIDPSTLVRPDGGLDASGPTSPASLDAAASLLDATLDSSAQRDANSAPDALTPSSATTAQLDLLFVIDNSGSMASEQERLRRELPMLIRSLTLGDRTPDASADPGRNDATRYFPAIRDLHLGVVTTNLGGIDEPSGTGVAVNSCAGLGDDAKLQNSTVVAREGVIATNDREFEGYVANEVVLAPDSSCSDAELPRYLSFEAGKAPVVDVVAANFGCVARVGVRGCPFEQQLEAMWKALAPADQPSSSRSAELYTFLNDTRGQGTRENAGFLREQATLAVVHVSDEEDCSIRQLGKALFDLRRGGEAEMKYGEKINLRCGLFGEADRLVWPVDRYVDGLKALKPGHPERLIFAALVGVPTDVGATANLAELLERPAMQFAEEGSTGLPRASCTRPSSDPQHPERLDKAYPGRRFVEVAKEFGENALVHSICADDYGPVVRSLVDKIASNM